MLFVDWLLIFSILISSIAASRDGKSDGPSFTRNPSGQASTLNPEQAGGPSSAAFPSLSMVPVSRMRQTQTRHPIKIPGKHFIEPDFVAAVGGPSILAPGTNWHKVWTAFKAYHDQMPISMPHALSSGKGESSSKQERSALKEEDTPCVGLGICTMRGFEQAGTGQCAVLRGPGGKPCTCHTTQNAQCRRGRAYDTCVCQRPRTFAQAQAKLAEILHAPDRARGGGKR